MLNLDLLATFEKISRKSPQLGLAAKIAVPKRTATRRLATYWNKKSECLSPARIAAATRKIKHKTGAKLELQGLVLELTFIMLEEVYVSRWPVGQSLPVVYLLRTCTGPT